MVGEVLITIGSAFSGCGALDYALTRDGLGSVAWQAESQHWPSATLAAHWPGVTNLGDVRAVDWHQVEAVDVSCAGWPCQPLSSAGKQRGVLDERWKWPEIIRAHNLALVGSLATDEPHRPDLAWSPGIVEHHPAELGR